MKRLLFFISVFLPLLSFGQDTLFFSNGHQQIVHIVSLGRNIVYTKINAPSGPKYVIKSDELESIHTSNGKKHIAGPFIDELDTLRPRKLLSLSTNLVQTLINQLNISAELNLSPKITVGVHYGKIFYNPVFNPFVLSSSQLNYPGTVYRGDAYGMYIKGFYNAHSRHYISLRLTYKRMAYSNLVFSNKNSGDYYRDDTRSESTAVYGFELVAGKEWTLSNGRGLLEFYYGLGLHVRERNITTYSISLDGSAVPSGIFVPSYPYSTHLEQEFPTLEIGFVWGFNIKRKHQ
jgi:hypothetical protein